MFSFDISGQNIERCGTVEYNESLRSLFQDRVNSEDFEKWMRQRLSELKEPNGYDRTNPSNDAKYGIQSYTIPLIFHIVHDGEAIGATANLDAQYVNEQIEQLNLDFANLSGSHYSQSADAQIQFCAAKIDPQGNCLPEPGINRINRNTLGINPPPYSWTYVDSSIKPNTQWNPNEYANIWSLDLQANLGVAQFPEATYLQGVHGQNGAANTDGIILNYSTIGSLNLPFPPSTNSTNRGRTLSHEMGHWLGLMHIWGDSNNCSKDDFCLDTPPQSNDSTGCPIGNDSCTNDSDPDMVENYMTYANDACMHTFTADQRDRMLVVMDPVAGSARRASLNNSPACGCAPIADFTPIQSSLDVCVPSGSIQFTNESTRTYSNSTYAWTFSGAGVSPTSSSAENPTVTISGNGTITATLTVTTANGTDTKGPISISVNSITSAPSAPILQAPINNSSQNPLSPTLSWNPLNNTDSYFIEVATDPAMSNIVFVDQTANTSIVVPGLSPVSTYFWRVIGVNDCNMANIYSGTSSPIWTFTTISTTCTIHTATDTPKVIATAGTPTVNSEITIPTGLGMIASIEISKLSIEHSWIKDLTISLTHSSGISVLLIEEICGNFDDINLIFSDSGSPNANIPCPATDGLTYQAAYPFSIFNGMDPAGSWTLSVSDAVGGDGGNIICWDLKICTEDVIVCPGTLSVNATGTNINCNGQSTGSLSASVSGGISPFTYVWQNSLGQAIGTSASLNNLPADSYTVFVNDANGCSVPANVTLTEPSNPLSNSFIITDVSCVNGSTGSITNTTSGGTLPYTYNWSNGSTTSNITNLTAGSYSLTITDINNCPIIENYTVSEPSALIATGSVVNVNCAGNMDGSISLSTSGGETPYAYNWSNGNTTNSINNLTTGGYSVTITDNNNCTITENYTVTEPSALSSTPSTIDVNCSGGTDGSISVTTNGGMSPYTYNWSNGGMTNQISGLTAGAYDVTITDINLCDEILNITVNEPSQQLSVFLQNQVNTTCNAAADGELDIQIAGGTPPYTLNWSNGNTTNLISNLSAGSYDLTVTDDNLCETIGSWTITEPSVLETSVSSIFGVSCNGGNDGQATASTLGGTPPYTYNWSSGETTPTASNLSSGSQSVTVTDDKLCEVIENFSVSQPNVLDISIDQLVNETCNNSNDGSITVSAIGGVGPYTYSWSNGSSGQSISGLNSGTYTVTILDDLGCDKIETITIQGPMISYSPMIVSPTCVGNTDGSITVNLSGGAAPYTYLWSNGQTTSTLSGAVAGTYSLTVNDNNMCVFTEIITIPPANPIVVNASGSNLNCSDTSNGILSALATGGTAPYTYNWADSSGNPVSPTGLIAGTYDLTVTDDNGCMTTSSATINPPVNEYTMANGNMLTGNQLFSADYEVDGPIESDQNVDSNGNMIDYDSGIEITLKAGFEVKSGTIFHAFINGCGGSM